jgi:tetratricopeptide (TPR) repeat protein
MSQAQSPQLRQALIAVGDALRRGDIEQAMNLSQDAVASGLEEANILVLAGQARLRLGKPQTALPVLTRAVELAPQSVEALNGLGICLTTLGRPREAAPLFEKSLTITPDVPFLIVHLATAFEDAGELKKSQAALESALRLQPNYTPALARLAGLHARRGEMDKARDYANRTLKFAFVPGAAIALAMADFDAGHFAAARSRASQLANNAAAGPVNQFIALGIVGDTLDAEGKAAEAFAAYTRAREILRAAFAPQLKDQESAIGRVQRLIDYFRDAPAAPWRAVPSAAPPKPAHVFLVGFPRSGTTLLEQALASHPDIRTLEEANCLSDTITEFVDTPDSLAKFAALDDAGLAPWRAAYWKRVAEAGGQIDRPLFIDKLPLNAIHLGLIARLFPDAKIVFSLRDPRDVLLSCFRRRLVMSAHMFELTRLDSAAAFYDAVMTLADLYRDRLGLPILDIRHEDLVADFDGQMRRVVDFIGAGWNDAMRDFAVHARDRDIKTPSASQVVRGLNADGAGPWKKYRDQLGSVLPVLGRWAARFGYKDA